MQALSARRPFSSGLVAPARPLHHQRNVAVAVKPTKAADFRGLSDEEIATKIGNLKTELASVRFLQRMRGVSEIKPGEAVQPDPEKIPRPHLNKHIRKQIAQLWTVMRERQVQAGMSARDSRKQLTKAGLGL